MPRVALPEGCFGLEMADGTKYNADRNGRVQVADRHASAIKSGFYGAAGVMTVSEPTVLGTKRHRTCFNCSPSRRWNIWTTDCPRCGASTSTEEQTT